MRNAMQQMQKMTVRKRAGDDDGSGSAIDGAVQRPRLGATQRC